MFNELTVLSAATLLSIMEMNKDVSNENLCQGFAVNCCHLSANSRQTIVDASTSARGKLNGCSSDSLQGIWPPGVKTVMCV